MKINFNKDKKKVEKKLNFQWIYKEISYIKEKLKIKYKKTKHIF